RRGASSDGKELVKHLEDRDPSAARAAGNALASLARPETTAGIVRALQKSDPGVQLSAAHALGEMPSSDPTVVRALLQRLEGDADPALEHQLMFALLRANQTGPLVEAL